MKALRELKQAARLNAQAGAPPIPSLYFLTDPERVPDPIAAVRRLPRGTAVIYRHFGAPDRARVARRLAAICRARDLTLLISADPALAEQVGARGVHWPERRLPRRRQFAKGLVTVAAHGAEGLARAERFRRGRLHFSAPFFRHGALRGTLTLGCSERASLRALQDCPWSPSAGSTRNGRACSQDADFPG